jgi:hypothetical protein
MLQFRAAPSTADLTRTPTRGPPRHHTTRSPYAAAATNRPAEEISHRARTVGTRYEPANVAVMFGDQAGAIELIAEPTRGGVAGDCLGARRGIGYAWMVR